MKSTESNGWEAFFIFLNSSPSLFVWLFVCRFFLLFLNPIMYQIKWDCLQEANKKYCGYLNADHNVATSSDFIIPHYICRQFFFCFFFFFFFSAWSHIFHSKCVWLLNSISSKCIMYEKMSMFFIYLFFERNLYVFFYFLFNPPPHTWILNVVTRVSISL